jgi:hypothetical protein
MEALLHLSEIVLGVINKVPKYQKRTLTNKGTELRIFAIKRWIYALVHKFSNKNMKNKIFKHYLDTHFTKVWFSDDIVYSVKNRKWIQKKGKKHITFSEVHVTNIEHAHKYMDKSLLDIVRFTHNMKST